MSQHTPQRSILVTSFGLLFLAASCQSTGVGRTEASVESTSAAAGSIEAGKKAIKEAIAAMDGLAAPGADLKAAFNNYVAKLQSLESARANVKSRAEAMKAKGDAFLEGWAADLEKLEDPDLKLAAKDRRAQAEVRLERIRALSEEAGAAYDALSSRLASLKTFLENDLTPAGVKGAEPSMAKARQEASSLVAILDKAVAELTALRGAIGPGTAPTPATTK